MHFLDLSASQDIGASCYLLSIGPFKLVVDCGIHPKKIGFEAVPDLKPLDDVQLDAIILTHTHLDHLGALPLLASRQAVPIYTSQGSKILGERMLHNSVNVMQRQCDSGEPGSEMLYTHGQVDAMAKLWQPLNFADPHTLEKAGEKLLLTLYPAGHVVGAVGCKLEYRGKTIFLTGDVLFENQITLNGASFPTQPVDTLILETTRGNTLRKQSRAEAQQALVRSIRACLDQGGYCLLPLFALGRLQEILVLLYEAIFVHKTLDLVPIYASGLGLDLVGYMDEIYRKTRSVHFSYKIIRKLKVKKMNFKLKPGVLPPGKGIFLMSSGMMVEHTPSYAIAASILHDPKSLIAFTGYCDPDTPGGKLLQINLKESMLFEAYQYATPCRATIERFDLSAHADREELIRFACSLNPKRILTVHGEPEARAWVLENLRACLPAAVITNSEPGKIYDLSEATLPDKKEAR